MKRPTVIGWILALGALLPASGPQADVRVYEYRQPDGTVLFTDRKIRHQRPVSVRIYGRPPAVHECRLDARRQRELERYTRHINHFANQYGVDPKLVRAVIATESCFNPRAVSRVGAQGLMQLMPETARLLGVKDPFDPRQNIAGGVRYLRMMLDEFDGDFELALAAYNAGPEAVKKYKGIPPYRETRNYVRKILRLIHS